MFTGAAHIFLGWLVVVVLVAVNATDTLRPISKLKATNRIVNGNIIPIEEAPFMVQMRNFKNFTICGGTLISLQHVLTAAHCLDDEDLKLLTIVGGVSLRNETGVVRKIEQAFIHPYRKLAEYRGDVAVLKLNEPFIEGKKIKPHTKLCSSPPAVGEYIQVSGWGAMRSLLDTELLELKDFSQELRKVRVPIISDDDCREKLIKFFSEYLKSNTTESRLTSTNICAYKEHHDSCTTDSGGPGIYRNELCAVVSWGVGCAYRDYPSIYTSVSTVRDFIEEKLKV